jgi:hypothetical protein
MQAVLMASPPESLLNNVRLPPDFLSSDRMRHQREAADFFEQNKPA